ncbi:MAG: hypothetical protein ABGY71_09965 [bacterium]|nr:hypothetical protein [Planctomycetota bacterium]HIL51242.1 hypothetical protein [Planctomycetota bacterium]
MTRAQAWAIHASNLLVGVSGLIYGWMRYFAQAQDEFSVVNHPWQPAWQHAHVLLAPLLVFSVGLVWSGHIWKRYSNGHKTHRKSGLALALLFFPMLVSGYALQISATETWREIWIFVHLATSLVWLLFGVIHPLLRRS